MDKSYLINQRGSIFSSDQNELFQHLGFFICWFGQVEMALTILLGALVNSMDLRGIEVLVQGMDARVKVQRLRALAKQRSPIQEGSNLDVRLKYFHDKMIKLRNNISHAGFSSSGGDDQQLHFLSIRRFPKELDRSWHPDFEEADTISFLNIFKAGLWLNFFSQDLTGLLSHEKIAKGLEIENPHSWEPKAFPDIQD